ncbi:hypothetical protein AB0H73_06440 [Streptomyces olivoreticuli]
MEHEEKALQALEDAWLRENGADRVPLLLTALTHALLASLAKPPEVLSEKPPNQRMQLLALIQESGGQWNWVRARGALAALNGGEPKRLLQKDLNQDLGILSDAGYLVAVEGKKFVYELAPTQEP